MNDKEFSLSSGDVAVIFFVLISLVFMVMPAGILGSPWYYLYLGVISLFALWVFYVVGKANRSEEKSGEAEALGVRG